MSFILAITNLHSPKQGRSLLSSSNLLPLFTVCSPLGKRVTYGKSVLWPLLLPSVTLLNATPSSDSFLASQGCNHPPLSWKAGRGSRQMVGFGTWRGWSLNPAGHHPPPPRPPFTCCVTWATCFSEYQFFFFYEMGWKESSHWIWKKFFFFFLPHRTAYRILVPW